MGYETIRLEKPFVVDEIISIHYFEYTSTYSFEGESHNFWEFLYVDKGEVSVCAGECQHILQKGQIIFHKPGEFHSLCSCGGTAPNLVVVGFVCNSQHMRFFEERIESLGDSGRALLASIVTEASAAFSSNLGDPQMLRLDRRESAPFCIICDRDNYYSKKARDNQDGRRTFFLCSLSENKGSFL